MTNTKADRHKKVTSIDYVFYDTKKAKFSNAVWRREKDRNVRCDRDGT